MALFLSNCQSWLKSQFPCVKLKKKTLWDIFPIVPKSAVIAISAQKNRNMPKVKKSAQKDKMCPKGTKYL